MFVPKQGDFLNITLPGELLRALVRKVVTKNSVIVEIATQPLAKSHQYKFRDLVACRRKVDIFGEEWEAVERHQFDMENLVNQEKEEAAKKAAPVKNTEKPKKSARK